MTFTFDTVTTIAASPKAVFDASLDIDAHLASMEASGEKAIAGVTSGLIGPGETVTWRAKHFGITWKMTSKITEYERPHRFVDEQVRGPFHRFYHEHRFTPDGNGTIMADSITFEAPFGLFGRAAERLILNSYLPKLIAERNSYLKTTLEA